MGQNQKNKIGETIGNLTAEHYVEVCWIDACEIREASEQDIDRAYYTEIKALGRFYAVKGEYLILTVENSPTLGMRVLCIPVGCIKKVKILTRKPVKTPLRIVKAAVPFKVVNLYVKGANAQNQIRYA